MKISNIKNLITNLNIHKEIKEDLLNNILIKNISYKEDVLDFILIYISNIEENASNIVFNDLSIKLNLPYKALVDRCKWLKMMKLEDVQLHKNHVEIYKIFDKLNVLFYDNNIEHHYTSGILAFLLIGKKLERYHHDIDIFVNEDNLITLEKVSPRYGFKFFRQLGNREDGTKRIMIKMQYKNIDIPITIFMYKREKDNSITQKDYFYDLKNHLMVEYIYNNPSSVELSFDNNFKYFHNLPYKAITLEALYLCKMNGRPKDRYDCEVFQDYVQKNKLKQLISAIQQNKSNRSILLEDLDRIKFLTKNNNLEDLYEF